MLLPSPKATVLQTVLRLYQYNTPKMVGAVGLAPTKAFRPGDLQSPAIAAMRYSQKIKRDFHLNLHQDFTRVKQFRTCLSIWFVFYQLLVPLENGSRGGFRTPNPAVNSRMLYHWATLELKWLPRKDSHLHKNVNSVPCYFDTTQELLKIKCLLDFTMLVPSTNHNLVRL